LKVAVYIKSCPQKQGYETKTALKQETYNLSDLKQTFTAGTFVELGDSRGPGHAGV
jgi:hypothetical protein